MTKLALILSIAASLCAMAQEPGTPATPPAAAAPLPAAPPTAVIQDDPVIPDDGVRVAVLGYHDLSEGQPETAMRMHTSKFRRQMEAIRQLGISVITLDDFLAWKRGEKAIPAKSILITLDDGWKSVYTDAYPILKELNFPFTLYLYKDYVDGGGKALTTPMIEEMLKNGASIGSHSVSHPFPVEFKSRKKKGADVYDAFIRLQMGESKTFLQAKFPTQKVVTYAYPGGYHTEEMLTLADELKYEALFTVIPGKVKRGTPNKTIPRYMILGNYDKIFDFATNFGEAAAPTTSTSGAAALAQTTPYPVNPEPGAIINSRLPEISADLSKVPDLNPATLSMKVSGFGEVPAVFSPDTKKLSWTVNRRLRQPICQVQVTWKNAAGKEPESPLRWTFQIDRDSAYLPDGE